MKIYLDENEIITALQTFAESQINIAPNHKIDVEMKAGRGDNGYSATLTIVPNLGAKPAKVTRSVAPEPEAVEEVATPEPEVVDEDPPTKVSKLKLGKKVVTEPEEEEAPVAPASKSVFSKIKA